MVLGTNGQPHAKEWSWTFMPSLTKTNSKDQCKTNARLKSIKLLETNIVVNQLLHQCRRAERSYSTFKVRRGSHEEIPLIQGKEQWLRFAGAAMKRYPKSKVREPQVRR